MINENNNEEVVALRPYKKIKSDHDRLFGIVVSTTDYHPIGLGFDPQPYLRKFSGSIGS